MLPCLPRLLCPHLVLLALDMTPGVWRWLTLDLGLNCNLQALQLHHTFTVPWAILGAEHVLFRLL